MTKPFCSRKDRSQGRTDGQFPSPSCDLLQGPVLGVKSRRAKLMSCEIPGTAPLSSSQHHLCTSLLNVPVGSITPQLGFIQSVPAGAQAPSPVLGKGFHLKIKVHCSTNSSFRFIPGFQGWHLSKHWFYKRCLVPIPAPSDVSVGFAIQWGCCQKNKRGNVEFGWKL